MTGVLQENLQELETLMKSKIEEINILKNNSNIEKEQYLTQIKNLNDQLQGVKEELELWKVENIGKNEGDNENQHQISLDQVDILSKKDSGSKKLSLLKEEISLKQNTIDARNDISHLPNLENEKSNTNKNSFEKALEEAEKEENQVGSDIYQEEGNKESFRREMTKSSKPSTWNTNKINRKIGDIIGCDMKEIHYQLIQLENKIDKIKFLTRENTREIEFNRHKIFTLIRTQKGDLSFNEAMSASIKKGIKQAKISNLTQKEVGSYFQRFQSPNKTMQSEKKNRASSFIQNIAPEIVNLF